MTIGAAVDNAAETSGDLNKEAWDKYNALRLAILVDHTTGGLHTALSSSLISDTDDTDDLGSATKEWRNLYIDGVANIDSLVADTVAINGGTVDGITSLTAGGNLDIGAYDLRAATLTADGLTTTRVIFAGANGLLSDDAKLTWSTPTLSIVAQSETAAGNALWIDLRSTVTSGDLTGIRSRVYGNAASAGANVRGGYLEAKMEAGKYAAMLEGILAHADYSAGSITVSGDVRGFTAHISQGAGLNAANLYGGLISIQTRGDETITTDDVGLMIRNEAVGGSGRTMDAGFKLADLNMGGGTKGFGYGIDLNGVGITTADIRFSGGQVITSSASLLTMPAIALTDVTMSLDSDADGDIYYRASNKLVRLAKGTAAQGLVMNGTATAPEWATAAGGGIDNVVEDTTPQLGGELDCQAHTIGFTQQTTTGDGTTTIDWKLGNKFYFTFGAQNDTFTFTQPTHECNLLLVLKQDGTGSRLATWPNTVKWPAGTASTLSTGANDVDIISFYWDGTNYHGSSLLDFSVPA